MEQQKVVGSIKRKIIQIILFGGLFLTTVFVGIVVLSFQKNLRLSSLQIISNVHGMYDSILKSDTKMLSAALDAFTTNDSFKQVYQKRDRVALYNMGKELFNNNRSRYGMTHFYYIDNNGICFLRMHRPDLADDQINRVTFRTAKETNRIASGIELGKTAFALRVVKPYEYKGVNLGYVEFGEEIDHFDRLIKGESGSDVAVLVEKKFLDEKEYRATRQTAGQVDDWDDLKNYAVVSETFGDRKFFAGTVFKESELASVYSPAYLGTVKRGNRVLMKGAFPLTDAAQKPVGVVMVLSDVTALSAQATNVNTTIFYLIIAAVLFLVATSWLTYRYLKAQVIDPMVELSEHAVSVSMGNVDKAMQSRRTDEIGLLIKSFERMRTSLKVSLSMLSKKDVKPETVKNQK